MLPLERLYQNLEETLMSNKTKFKYIFVILTYKNSEDIVECEKSIKEHISNYKIVVVNSYFDDASKDRIQKFAIEHDCDFLNVENKGYSFGNNRGIEYANEKYDYDYIIISNPDIIVRHFDEEALDQASKYAIIAPSITAKSGKKQNPISIHHSKASQRFIYKGFKKGSKFSLFIGLTIGWLNRHFFKLFHLGKKKPYKIYCAHGSFVILRKSAVDVLYPVYDENMFLFAEEGLLALRAKQNGLLTGQLNAIDIFHKEDGSMSLADFSIDGELKKSNIYFYEIYVKKPKGDK